MAFSLDPDGGQPIYTPDYEPTEQDYPEDNAFLNDVDKGYIGFTKPQVVRTYPTPIEHLRALQGDWPDKDNDPASPEQAWA